MDCVDRWIGSVGVFLLVFVLMLVGACVRACVPVFGTAISALVSVRLNLLFLQNLPARHSTPTDRQYRER